MTTSILLNNGNEFIDIDATVQAAPTYANRVTKNRVESGGDITDHITDENLKYTLSGIITDSDGDDPEKHATAFDRLVKASLDREFITIQEEERIFTNMVIVSLSAPIDTGTGQAFKFTLQLEQIRTAITETFTVDIDKLNASIKVQFAPKKTNGTKGKRKLRKKESDKSKSFLARLFGL